MYYPSLIHLKEYRIEPYIIDKLDRWLALQLRSTYHFLNPLQFSIDMNLETEISIKTFALCTHHPISIMKTKYRIFCPNCGEVDQIISNLDTSREFNRNCSNCSRLYNVIDFLEFVELYFELLFEPVSKPSAEIILPVKVEALLGKSDSLRVSEVNNSPSIRGLLMSDYGDFRD